MRFYLSAAAGLVSAPRFSYLCIMADILQSSVKYVTGVGEARARLLEQELGIFTVGDLLRHYPFRYIDR